MKKFIDESWLVVVMGAVFACLLAATQTAMMPKIRANEAEELMDSIAEVVPNADPAKKPEKIDPEALDLNVADLKIGQVEVYKCLDSDAALAGWAIQAEGTGFIDKIRIVVGLSPDGGEILGIKAIKHAETPGLGNKIDTKGEENAYPLQYRGKGTGQPLVLLKGKASQPNQIEAITGATYSSQYTMDIVNEVIARIVPKLPRE